MFSNHPQIVIDGNLLYDYEITDEEYLEELPCNCSVIGYVDTVDIYSLGLNEFDIINYTNYSTIVRPKYKKEHFNILILKHNENIRV